MRRLATACLLLLALAADALGAPRHFVFFGSDRERIRERSFLDAPHVAGAQLRYSWRELEPERGRYALGPLLEDLAFLERHGKRLWVQIQDVSFSARVLVPEYLVKDPAFGGGVAPQFSEGAPPRFAGWVARRWDPAVRARFVALLEAVGAAVDGRVEGVNLAETSIELADPGPAGFTPAGYAAAIREIMTAARKAFSRSRVIVYANFMPGEWLPHDDRGHLRAIYAHAGRIGVGVGGPDLLPHRKGQRNHSLPLIAARGPDVVAGVAVQDGNLADKDAATGRPVTVAALYRFARDSLRLDYLFWGTEEPYYSRDVLPFLRALAAGAE